MNSPSVLLKFLLGSLILALAPVLAADPPAQKEPARIKQAIEEYTNRLEKFGFSGAVLVAQDDRILVERGYGLADRTRRVPYQASTVSTIGSITKQFTAAAILKLEMQGRLNVTDPISKYLPGVPADKTAITLHHLLTHTAGFRGDLGGKDSDPISREAFLRVVLSTPLEAPPGNRHIYSNEGYSLLGIVIELVSGQPYEHFLREQLFKPAGMTRTGYVLPRWEKRALARGYMSGGQDWGTVMEKGWGTEGPGWYLKANGGIHSTLGDLFRWHRALEGERVLNRAEKEKFFKPYVEESPGGNSYYAYGWAVETTPRNTRLIAHNGGNGIFAADFRRYVDEGVVMIAFSNAPTTAIDLTEVLPAIVFGGTYTLPPATVSLAPRVLESRSGAYVLPSGQQVRVSAGNGGLKLSGADPSLYALLNGLTPPSSERSAEVESTTRALIESAAQGDFQPIHQAFGGRVPFEDVQSNEQAFWQQLRRRHGEFTGVDLLGSSRGLPVTAVHVRLRFARGEEIVRYGWQGKSLVGIRLIADSPDREFLPVSSSDFASFNLRRGESVQLRFDLNRDGTVLGLKVVSQGREIAARRLQ